MPGRGPVMSYRCRSCGAIFNDVTGIPAEPEPPRMEVKSPLEGLSDEERAAKITEMLSKLRKKNERPM
jgi:rubredoxin